MLTVRPITKPEDAKFATDPLVAPSAFVRPQEPRAHTVWSGSDEALHVLGLQRGMQAKEEQIAAAIVGLHVDSGEKVRDGRAFDLTLVAPDSLTRLQMVDGFFSRLWPSSSARAAKYSVQSRLT
ncbi:hypothetical protein ACIQCJ_29860 [Streptomyces sp. NPDC093221]|uniref:hypothetical protein n=1 Tax=Streptomyces sp. NPDC093221 TaxID=3366032 RepID=UPI00382B3DE8